MTDPGATVTANGDPVFISNTGEFTEELTLSQGLNRITVRATNRFDKTKEETAQTGFAFRVRATTKAVSVTVVTGETVLYSGTLMPGIEEVFSGLSSPIRLTTDDALHTEAGLDDQPMETVGKEVVPVSGKIYANETQASKTVESVTTNP